MPPWPFIIAAYALTLVGTTGLCVASYLRMRLLERRAAALREGEAA